MRPVQCFDFIRRQPEEEVLRKSGKVAFDLLVQALRADSAQAGPREIQQHFLPAHHDN
ncbi:MAG TPA: hypothetical protein VID49_14675 [Steroidobacteraceae bacterium]|jgi:hypothetical protein